MNYTKIILFLFFLNCFIQKTNSQSSLHESLNLIKNNKYYQARKSLKNLNSEYKIIIKKWLNYYIDGKKLDTVFSKNNKNTKHNNLINLYLGDYHKEKNNDSLAYKYYSKVYESAIKTKDTLLINMSLVKLCDIQFIVRNDNILKKHINTMNLYKKDSVDFFYYHYFKIIKILNNNFETKQNEIPNFTYLEKYSETNSFLKAELHNLKGIYFDVFTKEKFKALNENNRTIKIYQKFNYIYCKKRINDLKINIGTINFELGKYKKAVLILEEALNKIDSNDLVAKRIIKHWLSKSYDSLHDITKALTNLKESNNLRNGLALEKHAKKIIEIDNNKQILTIEKQKASLKTKMQTILPILAIITLLLGVVFILYKKYYNKTEVLEEEKSETIKKIDELKQIVIKNHIILKDKTKVYIADLTYIKSDDHYLKVFLSNGKNHFVRGKLNKIVEELPPNFIRCHRSYIVNRNFIKQINNSNIILVDKTEIPLSRSYKDSL